MSKVDTDQVAAISPDENAEPPWIERSVASLLNLAGGTISTFLRLFYLPWQAPIVASQPQPAAPPLSFLIVCLLVGGVVMETFVLFFMKADDAGLGALVGSAVSELGPKEITLLTVPVVAMVVISGAIVGWLTTKSRNVLSNPVVRVVCYAAGVQVMVVALFLAALLLSKAVRGHNEVAMTYLDVFPLLTLFAIVVGSAAIQIERVIKHHGETWIARFFFFRTSLAFACSGALLLGTMSSSILTFDIHGRVSETIDHWNIQELEEMAAELGDDRRLFVDPIRTVERRLVDGSLRLDQVVSLYNASGATLVIPRPETLRPPEVAHRAGVADAHVESCSSDWTGNAGWVVKPGETQLVGWTLQLPQHCWDRHQAVLGLEFLEVASTDGPRHFVSPVAYQSPGAATFAFAWDDSRQTPEALEPPVGIRVSSMSSQSAVR